jgi:hypothetical protein
VSDEGSLKSIQEDEQPSILQEKLTEEPTVVVDEINQIESVKVSSPVMSELSEEVEVSAKITIALPFQKAEEPKVEEELVVEV